MQNKISTKQKACFYENLISLKTAIGTGRTGWRAPDEPKEPDEPNQLDDLDEPDRESSSAVWESPTTRAGGQDEDSRSTNVLGKY